MMDLALKTLILIIFILIPGFLFRRVYFQGSFSKQFDSKSWSHTLFYSILFGVISNIILCIYYELRHTPIDYSSCLETYNSITKGIIPKEIINNKVRLKQNILEIGEYILFLCLVAILTPFILHIIVRNLKLDRRIEMLRFDNYWHYYFKGEVKDFKEFSFSKKKCTVVIADILVKSQQDENNLYSGYVSSFSSNKNGDLESISLTQTKIFKRDSKAFHNINSTIFIIPNSNIQNINLRYTFEENDNTTIDFILTIILLCSFVPIWFDLYDLLAQNNLFSKIILKSLASFISFLLVMSLFISIDNHKLNKEIDIIKKNNTDDKDINILEEQLKNKKNGVTGILILSFLLSIILYLFI